MPQLIVNADDFGRAPGVNRGIIEAHRKGIVTSTTVMINLPDADAGLAMALVEAPNLGLGLHLNLTSGKPVLPADQVRSLVDADGMFWPITEWPAIFDDFRPDEIEAELTAQFDRFTRLAGKPPDHLDSHHHSTCLHPDALRVMLSLAAAHRLPIRQTQLFQPDEETLGLLEELLPALGDARGPEALHLMDHLRAVQADGPEVHMPDALATSYTLGRPILAELLIVLTTLPQDGVTELMCHPGYVDDALRSSRLVEQREAELAHLTHAATRECVQSEGIRLLTFADLA